MGDLTLAGYATEVERLCFEIDNCEGELPPDLIAKFAETSRDLATKVDNWIGFIDAVKSRTLQLKEHKERVTKAIKTAENFERSFKGYIKGVMQAFPGVPYKGKNGALYLHKNPKSVKIDFALPDATVYRVVDPTYLTLEPTVNQYVKTVTHHVIDTERLKADLEAGMQLPWARIEQDSHIRVKA